MSWSALLRQLVPPHPNLPGDLEPVHEGGGLVHYPLIAVKRAGTAITPSICLGSAPLVCHQNLVVHRRPPLLSNRFGRLPQGRTGLAGEPTATAATWRCFFREDQDGLRPAGPRGAPAITMRFLPRGTGTRPYRTARRLRDRDRGEDSPGLLAASLDYTLEGGIAEAITYPTLVC